MVVINLLCLELGGHGGSEVPCVLQCIRNAFGDRKDKRFGVGFMCP